MKKLIALALLLCLVTGLCACGSDAMAETTTVPATEEATEAATENATENATEAPTEGSDVANGMAVYTVTVVDEGGNPISGAFVQICKDDCFPGSTDENGVATFTRPETEGYKISFISLPVGYEYAGEETEFYYEGDAKELTISLKAVA